MTSEFLPGLLWPQLAPQGLAHPRNLAVSLSNLSLYICRHCAGWLRTGCRSKLLGSLVRFGALLLVLRISRRFL